MTIEAAQNLIIQHRIGLERYSVDLNKKILSRLNKAEAEIIAKIAALPALDGTTIGGVSVSTKQRLESVLAQVRATAVEAMAVINATVETELGELAVHEVEFAANAYKATLPFAPNFVAPSPQLLKAIVTSRPLQGRLIKDWLGGYSDAIKQKVHDTLMQGVIEGASVGDMVKRLRGTKSLNYGDAVLKGTKRGVEALVRTSVNHVTNAAHKAFLEDNDDVFDRYMWISVLDGSTTPVCRSRSGAVYAVGGTNPIPPAHINCRSTIAPVLIGEEVAPVNTYAKWLGAQPEAVQVDVLGPVRHKLWKDGRLTMDKFVADSGRPLTLEQLKANDAKAWEAAFGRKTTLQAALNPGKPKHFTPPDPVQIEAAKTKKKTAAAVKAKYAESAEAIAAKKAAEAEALKQVALANAEKAAKEAAEAKKNAALARADADASNGMLKLAQPASSTANNGNATKYGGSSADKAKASPLKATVPLDQIEIVFSGDVSSATVKSIIENFDPTKPVFATKIGEKFHLIEGKSVVKAAELLKEPGVLVQYVDADEAIAKEVAEKLKQAEIETAKAKAAYEKSQAEKKELEKQLAELKAKRSSLSPNEIVTVRHEVAKTKDGVDYFVLKTEDREYFNWAGQHYHDVNGTQAETIDRYKGSTYQRINGMLREYKGDREAIQRAGGPTAKMIADMDRAFEKNEIPVNVLAFRGFDIRHALRANGIGSGTRLPAGFKPEDLIGKQLVDDGYNSFSVREKAAGGFANGKVIAADGGQEYAFVMERVVKKGTPGLRGTDYEQEIILQSRPHRIVGVRDETTVFNKATGNSYGRHRTIVLEVEVDEGDIAPVKPKRKRKAKE